MKKIINSFFKMTTLGRIIDKLRKLHNSKKNKRALLIKKYGRNEFVKFKKDFRHKSNRDFWFLMEFTHGNTGDIAIRYSEGQFFEKKYPNWGMHYVYTDVYHFYEEKIKKVVRTQDIIVLSGGGNIGDLYISYEIIRRNIIKSFPKNLIISMPQTCYFSDTENGCNEQKKSQEIYNAHKNLLLISRDEKSFEVMKKIFYNCNIKLAPDIVMTQNMVEPRLERVGVTLCFREDSEINLTIKQKQDIENICGKYFNVIKNVPMSACDEICLFENSLKYINDKVEKFKSSKLVITDRLHGMIFCAISGTPCIALPSYNHKVKATSVWLKEECSYIRFCEDISSLEGEISDLLKMNSNGTTYNESYFIDKFAFLDRCIVNFPRN